jgi:hypothetical protein
MRPDTELNDIIAATIRQSKGTAPFTILARTPAEAERLTALLRGRHGTRHIAVRVDD